MMGDYAELYRWSQCPHKGPYQREAGEFEKVMRGQKQG